MRPISRQPAVDSRRDPAPSRMSYRMQRLWLTPFFRVALRVGLPAFILAFSIGVYLSDHDRRASLGTLVTDLRDRVKESPQFMVTLMSVDGASPDLADAVRAVMALPLPESSFDLDLEAARERVAMLDAVSDVQLRVEPGGVLKVSVTERQPALVWRDTDRVTLLDATGHRVADIANRADRADLPLIAGDGADRAAPEARQILLAAGPLLPRLRGLVRMGERRWDLVLDRNQRILLPVEGPIPALERLIALDQAQDLMNRDIVAVDLRLKDRPTLRLAPYALADLRRQRGIKPLPETKS